LTEPIDVTLSSRIPWLVCGGGGTGHKGGCAESFLSVERGLFTINVTSSVESVPARVCCTGGGATSVNCCRGWRGWLNGYHHHDHDGCLAHNVRVGWMLVMAGDQGLSM
jgi:hypothetical protein